MYQSLYLNHSTGIFELQHQNDWISTVTSGRVSLQWRHNGRVTGLRVGNSPGTGEFPAQRASNAYNVSIWWRHHVNSRKRSCVIIWVRPQRCGCLVTWVCYQLIAKPGNKTVAFPWPDPYHFVEIIAIQIYQSLFSRTYAMRNFNKSLGVNRWFHLTLYWVYVYLSMLKLKLTHVNKSGPCPTSILSNAE